MSMRLAHDGDGTADRTGDPTGDRTGDRDRMIQALCSAFLAAIVDLVVWVEPVVSRGIDVMKGRAHVMVPNIEVGMRNRNYLQLKKTWVDQNPDVVLGILRAHIEASKAEARTISLHRLHLAHLDAQAQDRSRDSARPSRNPRSKPNPAPT